MQNLSSLLASDSYIITNRAIMRELGINEAILLGELISERDYWATREQLETDGAFFSTIENVEERTTLSAHEQRKALAKLGEKGIVKVSRRGTPAKRYIAISDNRIVQLLKILTTRCEKFSQQEVKNFNTNKNKERITKKNIEAKASVETQSVYDRFIKGFDKNPNQCKLTAKRKQLIERRLKDCGQEMVEQAIDKVSSDQFYRGENDRGWTATLEFILKSYEQVERLSQLQPRKPKESETDDFDWSAKLIANENRRGY